MLESGPRKEIPAVSVRSLSCPNCGATVTIRSFGQAVNVVCSGCHSILDAQNPQVQILQQFKAAQKWNPLIPLGSRGKIRGTLWEVVGFQRRQIEVEGVTYGWAEYVLFNPYKGFRYLTEYDGHWNYVSPLRSLPEIPSGAFGFQRQKLLSANTVTYLGETYRHFQTASAATAFVLGEFPWQVRVGEKAGVTDYVCPPRVLSSETSADKEVTWSQGEYMTGKDIWKAFSLPGQPPAAVGVYENQPSPLGDTPKKIWRYCVVLLLAALALWIFNTATSSEEAVFSNTYLFDTRSTGEASFVTEPFEFKGRSSPVKVETSAVLNNKWIYLNYALINQDTGQAYDFGREVSYYSGYDEDGLWTEGSNRDSVVLPAIPTGTYYLRVEPEAERNTGVIQYSVKVTHGVAVSSWFLIAAGLLLVPAILLSWRSISFEHMRWQESDSNTASSAATALSSLISRHEDDDDDS